MEEIIYEIQHTFGIVPNWERKLRNSDSHLKMFLEWKKSGKCCPSKCEQLYHNRLNYLKGWME